VAVSDAFVEALRDLLEFVPELRLKRMFGGLGVYSGDRMFALAADDILYLKVDEVNREAFAAEASEPLIFTAKDGRAQAMGYWRAPEAVWEDIEAARRWASLARNAATRAAAKKSKPRAKARELLISGPWDEGG
jgi:DNA transformation protein